jgi:glycosyltransferase involved in cell wall biosynthesis
MPHQIVVHVNEGTDGTLAYLQQQGIAHTYSPANIGICYAVNLAASLANQNYIVYLNDDMYVCPGWDIPLAYAIQEIGHDHFMLSGTLIEPKDTQNPCVIAADYGTDLPTFEEEKLCASYRIHRHGDWCGSAWPPTIVSKRMWLYVGGYSIELSPGMSSDDDLAMKMWHSGCRIFKGIGNSRIYHFQAKSTLRVEKNNGRKQFLFKWGINQSGFNKYFLQRGQPYKVPLQEPSRHILRQERYRAKLKMLWHSLNILGLGKLE